MLKKSKKTLSNWWNRGQRIILYREILRNLGKLVRWWFGIFFWHHRGDKGIFSISEQYSSPRRQFPKSFAVDKTRRHLNCPICFPMFYCPVFRNFTGKAIATVWKAKPAKQNSNSAHFFCFREADKGTFPILSTENSSCQRRLSQILAIWRSLMSKDRIYTFFTCFTVSF